MAEKWRGPEHLIGQLQGRIAGLEAALTKIAERSSGHVGESTLLLNSRLRDVNYASRHALKGTMPTVSCPVTISSPAPDPNFLAMGGKPNMVCGLECHVVRGEAGQVAEFRCPVGHHFFAPIPTERTEDGS